MDRFNTRPNGRVMFGGTYNGHPLSLAAALATIEALEADDRAIHRRLFRLGEVVRAGMTEIVGALGIDARPTSFGSVFVTYFTDRDVRSFDDALTNDAELYVGFHREMTERGFLMLPLNLKRNHLMAAHTDEDVARMLQAAEDVLRMLAARRNRPAAGAPAAPSRAAAS
jgi:glutamate-1-semialdehyde 2,1-aminomutase